MKRFLEMSKDAEFHVAVALSCIPDYVHDILAEGKRVYEKSISKQSFPAAPTHLTSLRVLCGQLSKSGIDCMWLYDAFHKELHSHYYTSQHRFYLGAFTEAMKTCGASLNQTKQALKVWAGISIRHTESCNIHYKENHNFSLESPDLIDANRVYQLASAVINNIQLPFPDCNAKSAFFALKNRIKDLQFDDARLPFDHDFAKKKR